MIYRYFPYTLELTAPLLVPSLDGDPNSARSTGWVPGAALRGMLARQLGDPDQGGAAERARFHELILSGAVRFLNAYPKVQGQRSVPCPLSLRVEKHQNWDQGGSISAFDLTAYSGGPEWDEEAEEERVDWPEELLGVSGTALVTVGGDQLRRAEVRLSGRVHQQRDREKGRAWRENRDGREVRHGAVYTYESLDAGQSFSGLVMTRGTDHAEAEARFDVVRRYLKGNLLLGRSRRAGYGGFARLTWEQPRERELEGTGLVARDLPAGETVRLLFLSSAVGRDPDTGQPDPAALRREVEERLGARVTRMRWGSVAVGGYNRKWGLELPQALAVQAGSVFLIGTSRSLSLAELLAIEHEGLGERREEGFGRVAFLQAPTRRPTLAWPHRAGREPGTRGEAPAVVRDLEGRILEEALRERVLAAVGEIVRPATAKQASRPASSLLGRLRTPLRGEPAAGLAELRTWLGDGPQSLKRAAREQLEECKVEWNGRRFSLDRWLADMAREAVDASGLERMLRLRALAQDRHLISETSALEWLQGESVRLRARLADEVLATLMRLNRRYEAKDPAPRSGADHQTPAGTGRANQGEGRGSHGRR